MEAGRVDSLNDESGYMFSVTFKTTSTLAVAASELAMRRIGTGWLVVQGGTWPQRLTLIRLLHTTGPWDSIRRAVGRHR
jgi:hypothetical protein